MASAKKLIESAQKEIARLDRLKKSGKEDPAYCDQQIANCKAAIKRLLKEK